MGEINPGGGGAPLVLVVPEKVLAPIVDPELAPTISGTLEEPIDAEGGICVA
jgi:hypothetical protein